LTNDEATGVTQFFHEVDGTDALPDEEGQMIIFDNTESKVLFQLESYNTSTDAMDAEVASLIEYANDAYAIKMEYSWAASEVAAT